MSINIGDVYRGYSKHDKSYKYRIVMIDKAYSAVLVECIDNPELIDITSSTVNYAVVGNEYYGVISCYPKRNSNQNLYTENIVLYKIMY